MQHLVQKNFNDTEQMLLKKFGQSPTWVCIVGLCPVPKIWLEGSFRKLKFTWQLSHVAQTEIH